VSRENARIVRASYERFAETGELPLDSWHPEIR
jgi:hypothetical protein